MAANSMRMFALSAVAFGVLAAPGSISVGSGIATAKKCQFTLASAGPAIEGGVRNPGIFGNDRGASSQGDTRSAGLGIVQAQGIVRGTVTVSERGDPLGNAQYAAAPGGGNGWGANMGPFAGTRGLPGTQRWDDPNMGIPYCGG